MIRSQEQLVHALRHIRFAVLFWRQMRALAGKELLQLFRDRALFFFIVYIFTMNILMAGHETRELHDAKVLVYDRDHSQASRDLISRFRLPYFRMLGETASPREGMRSIDQGKALVFIDIPERFERTLKQGTRSAQVQMYVDTGRAVQGYLAASYAEAVIGTFTRDWVARQGIASGQSVPAITNHDRMWFNPTMNDAWFSAIGELLTMMTVACVLLPASAMVRERERGTIEQLLVSPLSPLRILLPKVLAMTLVMLCGTAVSVLAIMGPVFGVPIRGSLPLFFVLTALFSLTTAGLGLAGASFARNSAQVGMLVLLVVLPIIVLSGTWTPLEGLPPFLNYLMLASPLRHFIPIAYGILQRGEGLDTLWRPAAAMAGLGIGLFAVAIWRFRSQFR